MGEIDKLNGSITLSGTISYAAQSACVLNATVRENILYGKEYDEARYERVVQACALVEDIDNLEAGDQTQIGEKGISLSGGQKQVRSQRHCLCFVEVNSERLLVIIACRPGACGLPRRGHLYVQKQSALACEV